MFKKLTATAINDALKGSTRQYLAGHLKLPQELDHIDDTNVGGTTILFIKTPPGNDKVVVEVNDNVQKWLEKWD